MVTQMTVHVSKRGRDCLARVYPEAEGQILIFCRWEALITGEVIGTVEWVVDSSIMSRAYTEAYYVLCWGRYLDINMGRSIMVLMKAVVYMST